MSTLETLPLVNRTAPIPATDSSAPAPTSGPPPLLSTGDMLSGALEDIAQRHKARQENRWTGGIRCGIPLLDNTQRGFRPGSVTILNAQPNIGKTTLCNQIAYQASLDTLFPEQKAISLFVSFENAPSTLLMKHLSRLSGWAVNKLEAGEIAPTDSRLLSAADLLRQTRLFYLGGNDSTTAEVIKARVREARERSGESSSVLLVIDYLQIFARRFQGTSIEQIGYALSALRDLAATTDAALLVIGSQNRGANQSGEAGMFGGRGSGEIEYDADTVLSLTAGRKSESEREKFLDLAVVKSRFSEVGGKAELCFIPGSASFHQMEV